MGKQSSALNADWRTCFDPKLKQESGSELNTSGTQ